MSNEQFYYPVKCDRCELPIEHVGDIIEIDLMGDCKYHEHCADVVNAILLMNDYSGGDV